jgi:tetratricopeptide (TPR) repeat protein
MSRQSLELARAKLGAENPSVADSLSSLGDALWYLGKEQELEATYREALAMRRKLFGHEHLDVANSLERVAKALSHLPNRLPEEEGVRREALAIRRRLLGNEDPQVAESLRNLAHVLREQGKQAELEAMSAEVLAMWGKLAGRDQPEAARSLVFLVQVLTEAGKFAEAEPLLVELLALQRRVLGSVHLEVAASLDELGGALFAQGKYAQAESAFREELAVLRKLFGDDHPKSIGGLWTLAMVLQREDKLDQAESVYREAVALARKRFGNASYDVPAWLAKLAELLQERGNLAEAETTHREAMAMRRKLFGDHHALIAASLDNLAALLVRQAKFDEVEGLFTEVLTPALEAQPKSAGLLRVRGNWRARLGHWQAAAADFSRLIEFEPDNQEFYHALAPLLVQNGDSNGYRLCCAQEFTRFCATGLPNMAERTAKDCLMLADSGLDLNAVSGLADTAITVGKDSCDLPWFQFCKALAEYRQAHFPAAADWAQKALCHAGDHHNRDFGACLVLAMAQYRSNQAQEAGAAFARGVDIAQKLPRLNRDDLGADWVDWIIAHALQTEAEALMDGVAKAVEAP